MLDDENQMCNLLIDELKYLQSYLKEKSQEYFIPSSSSESGSEQQQQQKQLPSAWFENEISPRCSHD